MASGRPTKYKQEYARQAEKLCQLGATNRTLAEFFEVSERTIERWTSENEAFCRALRVGKEPADDKVERALYERALGYSHPDIDIKVINGEIVETPIIKYYPPDTKAALAWLYNRRSEKWHPKPEDSGDGNDMAKLLAELIARQPN